MLKMLSIITVIGRETNDTYNAYSVIIQSITQ